MQCVGLTCRGRHTTELLMLLLKQDTFINQGHIGPHLSHMGTLGVIRNTQDSPELYRPHRQGHMMRVDHPVRSQSPQLQPQNRA